MTKIEFHPKWRRDKYPQWIDSGYWIDRHDLEDKAVDWIYDCIAYIEHLEECLHNREAHLDRLIREGLKARTNEDTERTDQQPLR